MLLLPWIVASLAGGCATPRADRARAGTSPAKGGEIIELNLITTPVGLDLDGKPGLDGFSVKVYANSAENPKAVPIRAGQLEILMFDGTFFGKTNVPPAARVWTFGAGELKAHEFQATLGTGYNFLLNWETNKPTRRLISVAARYTPPGGPVITSYPSSVTVIDH